MAHFITLGFGAKALNVDHVVTIRLREKGAEFLGADGELIARSDHFGFRELERLQDTIVPAAAGATILSLCWLGPEGDEPGKVWPRELTVLAWRVCGDSLTPVTGDDMADNERWLLPQPGGRWLAPSDADFESRQAAIEDFRKDCEEADRQRKERNNAKAAADDT